MLRLFMEDDAGDWEKVFDAETTSCKKRLVDACLLESMAEMVEYTTRQPSTDKQGFAVA